MKRIMKIKLEFLSLKVIDLSVEKYRENSLVFLLNLNNSFHLYKINQASYLY